MMGPKCVGARVVCGRSMGAGVGGRRMPMDGGLSGMGNTMLHGCPKCRTVLGPEQAPETNDACEDTHARKRVLLLCVCA